MAILFNSKPLSDISLNLLQNATLITGNSTVFCGISSKFFAITITSCGFLWHYILTNHGFAISIASNSEDA